MTAREAALRILQDILNHREFLHLALKKLHLEDIREQRFATALVNITLENFFKIDYVLSQFIKIRKTDPIALNILRLGAAQILEMHGVAEHAAVNESVRLAERLQPRLKGFVNGVLRNIVRERERIVYPDPDTDLPEYLHVVCSYPKWICELFIEQLGAETAAALLRYQGPTDLTAIRLTEHYHGMDEYMPGIYLDDAAYIRGALRLDRNEAFIRGAITAQGESSMLCVRAADIQPDDCVLDLCAAPGGKSAYAAQLASEGTVLACDIHEHRVRLIEETGERLGLANLKVQVHDARRFEEAWKSAFDVVLVDAPCSALGLLYRKPDVKIFKRREDLTALAAVQREILKCAAQYVAPGGKLIYSTCTIDQLENEANAHWFDLEQPAFTRTGLAERMPGRLSEFVSNGGIQLLPSRDNIDGFYIARFEKHADATRIRQTAT